MNARMKDTTDNMFVVLHMMGQLHDMGHETITTGEMANIMGVTKPTALKRLNHIHFQYNINRHTKVYRPNAVSFHWELSKRALDAYNKGLFRGCYLIYLNEIGVK